jgi:hypothetical protein
MLSAEQANKWSGFSLEKQMWEIDVESRLDLEMLSIDSRSQYLTVRSDDPLAIVSSLGLNCRQVTVWSGN